MTVPHIRSISEIRPGRDPGAYLDELLSYVAHVGASDLHVTVPSPPILRLEGRLAAQGELPPVTPDVVQAMFQHVATDDQRAAFDRELELDFAYSLPGIARFRVSAMQQRGTKSLAFRRVPFVVPSIEEMGIPAICKEFILKPRGLLLVTGACGSGKSTTLAAMLRHLNATAARNVITIEDPIEFLFHNEKCFIRQRELGYDTKTFYSALVHALRHDPDVIVIGEMRDLPTISTAITAAETGHLVIGTLHTIDAAQSIDRILDIFPPAQQQQIRLQVSQVLEGVLSQVLLPRLGGGRVAAFEIMPATEGIRRIIREGKLGEIPVNLEQGAAEGKQSMNQALADLVKRKLVAPEEALMKSGNPSRLKEMIAKTSDGRPSGF